MLDEINRKLDILLRHGSGANRLMRPKDVAFELGTETDRKDFRKICQILKESYGMRRIEGIGTRIPRRNFQKFLQDKYVIHNH